MKDRNSLYSDYENEVEFIEKGLHKNDIADEDLSPTETITVAALERQKAQLEAKKVQVDQQLKDILEQINKLDAQIARMKAT